MHVNIRLVQRNQSSASLKCTQMPFLIALKKSQCGCFKGFLQSPAFKCICSYLFLQQSRQNCCLRLSCTDNQETMKKAHHAAPSQKTSLVQYFEKTIYFLKISFEYFTKLYSFLLLGRKNSFNNNGSIQIRRNFEIQQALHHVLRILV